MLILSQELGFTIRINQRMVKPIQAAQTPAPFCCTEVEREYQG
jgi:hypothetical protein